MRLNHLDLPVADVAGAQAFFEAHFGFRQVFARGSALAVLADEGGFALTLSALPAGEHPAWPTGFHIGFNFDDRREVVSMHERLSGSGVPIHRELGEFDGAISFQCLAPGGVIVEFGAWPKR